MTLHTQLHLSLCSDEKGELLNPAGTVRGNPNTESAAALVIYLRIHKLYTENKRFPLVVSGHGPEGWDQYMKETFAPLLESWSQRWRGGPKEWLP